MCVIAAMLTCCRGEARGSLTLMVVVRGSSAETTGQTPSPISSGLHALLTGVSKVLGPNPTFPDACYFPTFLADSDLNELRTICWGV